MRSSTEAPVAVFTCVSLTHYTVSWPRNELHRRPQWRCSHAPRPPSTALRGPIRSSTKASLAVFACVSPTQYSASWTHRQLHGRPQW
eukprot:5387116-Pyramimonas_sp.AAC.1